MTVAVLCRKGLEIMATFTNIPKTLAQETKVTQESVTKWLADNSTWLRTVIQKHDTWLSDAEVSKYQYAYDGTLDEIAKRDKARTDGVNYKLIANYAAIIIDTLVDYVLGKSPIYTIEDPDQEDDDTEEADIITEYRKKITGLLKEKATLVLSEMLRQGCIAGYSAVILWVDEHGNIDYNEYPVQEVIPVFDVRGRLALVLRKYVIEVMEEGHITERTRLEIYDDRYITYCTSNNAGDFVLDESEIPTGNPIEHKAGRIPVAIYQNAMPSEYKTRIKSFGKSDLSFGAFDLIVAYAHGISDKANLVEYLQDMYLLLTGVDVDEEEVLKMRKARAIALKATESDAKFISQDQADGAVENFLTRLSKDIYDTTNTPRLSELSGATATEIKMKYAVLDIKAGKKEPRLLSAIKQVLAVLTDFLNTQKLIADGITDTYDTISKKKIVDSAQGLYSDSWIDVSLTRNLPQNYEEIANIVATLSDTVPDSYLYELLWFIDDPQKALEEMKAQKEADSNGELSALGYNTNTEIIDEDNTDDTIEQET